MSLRAVGRGVAAGLVVACLLALALAVTADRVPLEASVLGAALWVARVMVSTGAGWFAGRASDAGAAIHGTLAGLALAVVGSLVAAETGLPMGPLGWALAAGALFGTAGGFLAAIG